MPKIFAIALSGGVDSSVTAHLIKKQYNQSIVGVMANVNEFSPSAAVDAKKIADDLNIPFYFIDLQKEFKDIVIDYFMNEYQNGRTPNPCIICNPIIKFGLMYDELKQLLLANNTMQSSDDLILVTGHYAQIIFSNNRYNILKAVDIKKDQSYMLYGLSQEQLSRFVTPLGNLSKEQVRTIAKELNLHVANKPDSQDICFIQGNYKDYLQKHLSKKINQGKFIDKDGNVLGKHLGIPFYTIGQRKGIGIAAEKPLYVAKINSQTNEITLLQGSELKSKTCILKHMNWVSISHPNKSLRANVRIRYNSKESLATINILSPDTAEILFDNFQESITPGQAGVIYDGNILLGGGIISLTS